jgi:hypothetical protein
MLTLSYMSNYQVWFQNRRAKFRKMERAKQQQQQSQAAASSSSQSTSSSQQQTGGSSKSTSGSSTGQGSNAGGGSVSGNVKDGATQGKDMKSSTGAGGQQASHKSSVSQDPVTGKPRTVRTALISIVVL